MTPLVQELIEIYPGAEIDIAIASTLAVDIFQLMTAIQTIYTVPERFLRGPVRTIAAVLRFRRVLYDLVIDGDPCSQNGRLLARLANARYSLGYASPMKSGHLTHAVGSEGAPLHRGKAAVFLLRRGLGHEPHTKEYLLPRINLTDAERQRGMRTLENIVGPISKIWSEPIVGVYADIGGHSGFGSEWWGRFLSMLEAGLSGYRFIEIIPETAESTVGWRYPVFYTSRFRRMAEVLSNLAICVSADCGVMQLSHACGTPTVGLFSVTNPEEWGLYGGKSEVVATSHKTPEEVAWRVLALPIWSRTYMRLAFP